MKKLRRDSRSRKDELKPLAKRLRNQSTKGEVILWKMIRANALGVSFRRQYIVDDYIIDFYCPALKLAVEVDGELHDQDRDETRDKHLATLGITTHRIPSRNLFDETKRAQARQNLLTLIQTLSA